MGNCYTVPTAKRKHKVHSDGSVRAKKEKQRIELDHSDTVGEIEEKSMNAAETVSKEKQKIQLVHSDGGVEKQKIQLIHSDGSVEKQKIQLVHPDGNVEKQKTQLIHSDGIVEKQKIQLTHSDGGVEKQKIQLNHSDGGVEKQKIQFIHSDGSVEKQKIQSDGSVEKQKIQLVHSDGSVEKQKIQLIHSDGSVEIVDESINAGKIMESFPQHMLCSSDSFYIGQKIPALPHNEKLKMGHMYFLLPRQSFQSVLSLVSLPTLISPIFKASSFPTVRKQGTFVKPFEIEKVAGGPRMKICAEFILMLLEEGKLRAQEQANFIRQKKESKSHEEEKVEVGVTDGRLCNSSDLQMEYALLVKPRKQGWKPRLETIQEKENGWRFNISKCHEKS
ncbi:hypothetical protein SUGI_0970970 [Cryptomeria japonica]|nr:hypothetical protein SUGI_0970970 [Cryptomeria japonica]